MDDIDAAQAELTRCGADVSGVFHLDGATRVPGPAPGRESFGSYTSFNDQDGTAGPVQEVTTACRAGRLRWRPTARWPPWPTRYAAAAAHSRHEKEIGILTRTGRTVRTVHGSRSRRAGRNAVTGGVTE